MNSMQTKHLVGFLALLILSSSIFFGCVAPEPSTDEVVTDPVSASPGARLWADACVRCHNLRLPDAYSDSEWGIVVHHMRLRANLTGEESRAIVAFLKNGF